MHIKTNTVFIYPVLFGYVFVLLCICFGKENSVAWQHRICAIRSIYIYIYSYRATLFHGRNPIRRETPKMFDWASPLVSCDVLVKHKFVKLYMYNDLRTCDNNASTHFGNFQALRVNIYTLINFPWVVCWLFYEIWTASS